MKREYYHYDMTRECWGRWSFMFGKWQFIEANRYVYPNYPVDADLNAADIYDYLDNTIYDDDDNDSQEFYYGYKECERLGIHYTAPDPTECNNLSRNGA